VLTLAPFSAVSSSSPLPQPSSSPMVQAMMKTRHRHPEAVILVVSAYIRLLPDCFRESSVRRCSSYSSAAPSEDFRSSATGSVRVDAGPLRTGAAERSDDPAVLGVLSEEEEA